MHFLKAESFGARFLSFHFCLKPFPSNTLCLVLVAYSTRQLKWLPIWLKSISSTQGLDCIYTLSHQRFDCTCALFNLGLHSISLCSPALVAPPLFGSCIPPSVGLFLPLGNGKGSGGTHSSRKLCCVSLEQSCRPREFGARWGRRSVDSPKFCLWRGELELEHMPGQSPRSPRPLPVQSYLQWPQQMPLLPRPLILLNSGLVTCLLIAIPIISETIHTFFFSKYLRIHAMRPLNFFKGSALLHDVFT